jgi:hypothetical protein
MKFGINLGASKSAAAKSLGRRHRFHETMLLADNGAWPHH